MYFDFQIFLISLARSCYLSYFSVSFCSTLHFLETAVSTLIFFFAFFLLITMSGLLWWISQSVLRPHSLLCFWGNTHTICHCTQLHIPCIPSHVWRTQQHHASFYILSGQAWGNSTKYAMYYYHHRFYSSSHYYNYYCHDHYLIVILL